MSQVRIVLLLMMGLLLGGVTLYPLNAQVKPKPSDEERAAFQQAKQANTKEAYEEFLRAYPSGALYWDGRGATEDIILDEIAKNGVGQRFTIKEILPQKCSSTGSLTLLKKSSDSAVTSFMTLYPKDKLVFDRMGEPVICMGNKSIWRFIGKVEFFCEGCIFDGADREPLSFMLVDPVGFVYLDGKGTVTVKDRQVTLPLAQKTNESKQKKVSNAPIKRRIKNNRRNLK